ncbi:hypothetical protein BASA60_003367 [Batrachochytrium salamandrivorans]|nr:hypothetical protein BASA60_003367 [Batrachochytrium salamandrivorans]
MNARAADAIVQCLAKHECMRQIHQIHQIHQIQQIRPVVGLVDMMQLIMRNSKTTSSSFTISRTTATIREIACSRQLRATCNARMYTTGRVSASGHVFKDSIADHQPPTVFQGTVRKPDQDNKAYQIITLDNGLQAIVISDPRTDKAAAALDIHIGHLCDPDEVAGLAHFCEHLLFMYPSENEYSQFLSQHSGHSNAFTGAENTNYFFDVGKEHLEGALDRFSQFFIAPLFSDSCTERELNAVDSEHKKNLQNDTWRNYQLEKDLSNPNHPFVKFGDRANIMKVAVLGAEPIEVLSAWVVSKFSAIKNKSISVPVFSSDVLTSNELQKEIRVKPVKETRRLSLIFPVPDTREMYKSRPSEYASHLIGHECEGSILSLLKKRVLSAGTGGFGARGFEFMRISVELTESGLENYEEIIEIIFQYISLIKNSPIEEWIFHECQALSSMAFRFKEQSPPSSYVSGLAGDLQTYQPSDVISGPYLLEHLDRDAIKANFDTYSPESFRTMLLSSSFDTTGWSEARHYGTKYIVKDFSASLVQRLSQIKLNPELHLPKPNSFIPEDFSVQKVAVEKPSTHPMIILESPVLRLWHKQDDTFFVPRVNIYFDMTTPLAYQDATSCVLSKLFTDLFKDSLNEFSYYAEVAGLHYRFDNTVDGLMLSLHGYNDKMHILLDKIAEKMVTYVTNDQQFDRIKKQLAKSYRNLDIEAPESHAIYRVNQITQGRLFTHEEKLQALEPLTSTDVQTFFPKLFERMHIQQLAHGNISKQRAIDIGNILLSRLNPKALPESQRLQSMLTKQISEGSSYIHIRDVPNAENVNSAIEYILQVGSLSDQYIRTHLSILSQIGHEPVFDQLRTKEQLGYMVYSGIRKQPEMLSYRIIIQSERDPAYLESRIVAFLNQLETILVEMTPEDFKKHQTSIATKMLDTLKNLGQESSRYWGHINSLYYDFEQHITDAEQIHRITKDQLIAFYRKHISPDSKMLRKLSVHMRSQKTGQSTCDKGEAVLNASVILPPDADLRAFKEGLSATKPTQPIKPIETWIC